jgi:hypothetical protein
MSTMYPTNNSSAPEGYTYILYIYSCVRDNRHGYILPYDNIYYNDVKAYLMNNATVVSSEWVIVV